MIFTWKAQINFLLFLIAVDIVFSCLLTNCPRGGKRGRSDLYLPGNKFVVSKLKKCRLCSPKETTCLDESCLFDSHCKDEGICVANEVCCTNRRCKLHTPCRSDFLIQKHQKLTPTSIILTKILTFTQARLNDLKLQNNNFG